MELSPRARDIIAKIFQVLVIIAIIVFIVDHYGIQLFKDKETMLYILLIVYVLFLASQFTSTTFSLLRHKTTEMGIKNIMAHLVQTPPTIEFYCECYHYSNVRSPFSPPPRKGGGRKRSGGKHHSRNRRRKIVTWRETVYFPYYSARDVSGLFELNKDRDATMNKVYIKLELIPEINFADELSYMDYEIFRTDFYRRNRIRDQYMNYRETRFVKGLSFHNLVCLRDSEPCGINVCAFAFFTIIPLSEFYKCYLNSYCIEQKFSVRKLISTRYDLNMDQYQYFIPSINIPSQQYVFEPNNYNYLNNNFQVQKPTKKEIKQASVYKDKIPKYECVSYTSINGQIKVGVVQNDPSYCSANINEAPPPNCEDVAYQSADINNPIINNNLNLNNNMNFNTNKMNNGMDSKNKINNLNFNMNLNPNTYNIRGNNNNMNQEVDDSEDS